MCHFGRGLGAVYGVTALASKVLSLEGGSKHLEIHGETASDQLKPELHTLCHLFACEICGLGDGRTPVKAGFRAGATAKTHPRGPKRRNFVFQSCVSTLHSEGCIRLRSNLARSPSTGMA